MNINTVVNHTLDTFRQRKYTTTFVTLETSNGKIYEIKRVKNGFGFNLPNEKPVRMTLKKMKSFFSEMDIVRGTVTQKANF